MIRPTLYAMCGLAFSGKSTYARRLAAELRLGIVSLDAINAERGLDGAAGIPDTEWEKTSHMAMERARSALRAGHSIVIDDTFSHRFLRNRAREAAAECGAGFVLLFVDTPIETVRARRAENERTRERTGLAEAVFEHHIARFEFPGADEAPVRLASFGDLAAWLAHKSP